MTGSSLLRAAASAVLVAALALPAQATWSILVVNTKTGEMGFAGATCLENDDLFKWLPVVRVGVGAGMTQGFVDPSAQDKVIIWDGLIAGTKPVDIIAALKAAGGVGLKQFGVVDFDHAPQSWTGGGLGEAMVQVTGVSGDLKYAVQGNVLAGTEVALAAATALVTTSGDLSQKIMAAMEAARAMGGDGRCSCSIGGPTSCGAPPPSFTKSAHAGFVGLARIGDPDGACSYIQGCATGAYYLRLESTGHASDPDPVLVMQAAYDVWRANLAGRPDHLLSTVSAPPTLVADGVTSSAALVRLVDVDGVPLTQGGATFTVVTESGSPSSKATPGAVIDHGDGSYSLPFTAGTTSGKERFVIVVDDGVVQATLYPNLEVEVDPLADLHVGWDEVSAAAGAAAPFVLNLGPAAAGHAFILLGGVSGTSPGVPLGGGAVLPLNEDWFLHATLTHAGSALLPGSIGVLDPGGRAEASFVAAGGLLTPLVGLRIDWAGVDFAGSLAPTGAVGFDVLP